MFSDRGRYNFGTGLVFGEISVKDNTTETTLAAASIVQITNFDTTGEYYKTLPNHGTDDITILEKGIYRVEFHVHLNNEAVQTHVVDVSAYTNNGTVELLNIHGNRTLTGGSGDVGSMSGGGFVMLLVAETVELWATTDSGSDRNVTFEDMSLSVLKVNEI